MGEDLVLARPDEETARHGCCTVRGRARRAVCVVASLLVSLGLAAASRPGLAEDSPVSAAASPALGSWVYELRAGALAHDVDDLWSGSRRESGAAVSAEVIFAHDGLPLLFGRLRPNLGATLSTSGDTSKLYAGVLMEWSHRTGAFFDAGVAAAIHDGKTSGRRRDRKTLGSQVLFRIGFDLGWTFRNHHRLMVSFDHISNAYLASPNQGLDTLGVRYGYRF
jgi:hypothetical protein